MARCRRRPLLADAQVEDEDGDREEEEDVGDGESSKSEIYSGGVEALEGEKMEGGYFSQSVVCFHAFHLLAGPIIIEGFQH